MKKTKILLSVLTCLVFLSSFGFSNGLNLNGLGARAVAMGGAFVGLADDFTAFYWNPAGLARLKGTTFGLGGDLIMPKGKYELSVFGINAETQKSLYPAGILGFFTPIGDNLVVGLGVCTPSGLGTQWNGADLSLLAGVPPILGGTGNPDITWESFIGVITASPSIAVNIQDMFYLGAALNINYGMFNIDRTAGFTLVPVSVITPIGIVIVIVPFDLGQYSESSTGWGIGGTIGAIVKPIDQLSIGLSFRTASKVKFEGDASIEGFTALGQPGSSTFSREVTSPMWLGFGIAFNPMENLTITADAQMTNWKKLDTVETDFDDPVWAVALAEGGATMELHWESTWQIRFGLEYWLSEAFALRAGYYWDPTPTPDETLNVLIPGFDYNSISMGFGYLMNGLELGFTLEYLMGKERVIPLSEDYEMPGVYNMNVLAINFGLIYTWIK
jgi:long-chain fatty acid transport protein